MRWVHGESSPDRRSNRVVSTVDSFIAYLPEMLGAMALDSRCLVAIIGFADGRYVQFWVEPDGKVLAEVVSNISIFEGVALGDQDEAALRSMGWCEPAPGPSPNWRIETGDQDGIIRIVTMIRSVVYRVRGERLENEVNERTFVVTPTSSNRSDAREVARVGFQTALAEMKRTLEERGSRPSLHGASLLPTLLLAEECS